MVPLLATVQRPSGFVTRLRKSPAAEPVVVSVPVPASFAGPDSAGMGGGVDTGMGVTVVRSESST